MHVQVTLLVKNVVMVSVLVMKLMPVVQKPAQLVKKQVALKIAQAMVIAVQQVGLVMVLKIAPIKHMVVI